MTLAHPTEAIIDHEALLHNFHIIQEFLKGRSRIIAVVKANAYGHGIVPVSLALQTAGADAFGVAFVDEGIQLRSAGIKGSILVMGGMIPEQVSALVEYRLKPILFHEEQVQWLAKRTLNLDPPLPVHVKIDTGMGRLGIAPHELVLFTRQIKKAKGLYLEALMSHFSDDDLQNPQAVQNQMNVFKKAIDELRGEGLDVPQCHMANSAGILMVEEAWFDWVRPGIALYGYPPSRAIDGFLPLKPVLSLRSQITHLRKIPSGTSISYGGTFTTSRDSVIAIIPIGYADGYSRRLSNRGTVLIRGRRAQIVGRVCMDMVVVDVTDIPKLNLAEEVILLGKQGEEVITAMDLADQATTIPYEILSGIGSRIPRVYQGLA